MKIANNITDLVGATPLLKLSKLSEGSLADVILKLEYFNPCGSIKDRIALSMVEEAEARGLLKKGSVIIEPTSGNTGIGLAFIAAAKGYECLLTMPESMSVERRKILSALGAKVILTDHSKGMSGAIAKAKEIHENTENSFMPGQFSNPANPAIHYKTTGPEIWADTDGKIDMFVAGVGTGGTIMGAGKYLKEKNPELKIIAVEPDSSAVLSGDNAGSHRIQGIGAGFVPKIVDMQLIDDIIKISDEEALRMCRQLATVEGVFCGISSGANVSASLALAQKEENKEKTIVTIIPDLGDRYLSAGVFS